MKLVQVGLSWWICGPGGETLERHGDEAIARARLDTLCPAAVVAVETAPEPEPPPVVEVAVAVEAPAEAKAPTRRRRRRGKSGDEGA